MMAHEVYYRLLLTEQRVEARRANRSRGSHSANAAYKGSRLSLGIPSSSLGKAPTTQPSSSSTPLRHCHQVGVGVCASYVD
jgi:hypothetical protein